MGAPGVILVLVPAEASIVRVLWSSVAATLVVAGAFSCLILCLTRGAERRAAGRRRDALVYGGFSALSLGVFIAAVVYGLVLLTQKS